ncbi:MAG: DsbA family protein [Myxococcales bacterium]|nr:DsbA family protein [Myxococcales bacterium]
MSTRRILALLAALVLSLFAVADGVYLTLVHIDLEFGGGGVDQLCHALSPTGCAVTGGRFGDVAGVPVSVLGGAAALTCAILSLVGLVLRSRPQESARELLLVLASVSVVASAVMAALSAVEGAFCPFCLLWYGLNVALWLSAWMARTGGPRAGFGESMAAALAAVRRLAALWTALVFGASLAAGWFAYAELLAATERAEERMAEVVAPDLIAEGRVEVPELMTPPTKRAGPESGAPIQIIEFSDFQCPYCQRAWQRLQAYAEVAPVAVEFVHVNLPLDPKCNPMVDRELHPFACDAARAGECARREGLFWEYADLLYADQRHLARPELLDRAERLGLDRTAFERCLGEPSVELKILSDISAATKLDIHGTPALVIGGVRVRGVPRRPLLDRLLRTLAAEQGAAGS